MEINFYPRKAILCRTLMGLKNMDFSLECLNSFIQKSYHNIRLEIFEDGSLKENDIAKIESFLKDSVVITKAGREKKISEKLSQYPKCTEFRNSSVFGIKLFDTMLYDDKDFFYLDTDIYAIRKFILPDFGGFPIFMKDYLNGYCFKPQHIFKISTPLSPRINAGFYYYPSKLFNIDYIETVLAKHYTNVTLFHFWGEQTMWAFLAANAPISYYFNPLQIVLATHQFKINTETIAVHLVSPTRYLFNSIKSTQLTAEINNYIPITLTRIDAKVTKLGYVYGWGINKVKSGIRQINLKKISFRLFCFYLNSKAKYLYLFYFYY